MTGNFSYIHSICYENYQRMTFFFYGTYRKKSLPVATHCPDKSVTSCRQQLYSPISSEGEPQCPNKNQSVSSLWQQPSSCYPLAVIRCNTPTNQEYRKRQCKKQYTKKQNLNLLHQVRSPSISPSLHLSRSLQPKDSDTRNVNPFIRPRPSAWQPQPLPESWPIRP